MGVVGEHCGPKMSDHVSRCYIVVQLNLARSVDLSLSVGEEDSSLPSTSDSKNRKSCISDL